MDICLTANNVTWTFFLIRIEQLSFNDKQLHMMKASMMDFSFFRDERFFSRVDKWTIGKCLDDGCFGFFWIFLFFYFFKLGCYLLTSAMRSSTSMDGSVTDGNASRQ